MTPACKRRERHPRVLLKQPCCDEKKKKTASLSRGHTSSPPKPTPTQVRSVPIKASNVHGKAKRKGLAQPHGARDRKAAPCDPKKKTTARKREKKKTKPPQSRVAWPSEHVGTTGGRPYVTPGTAPWYWDARQTRSLRNDTPKARVQSTNKTHKKKRSDRSFFFFVSVPRRNRSPNRSQSRRRRRRGPSPYPYPFPWTSTWPF